MRLIFALVFLFAPSVASAADSCFASLVDPARVGIWALIAAVVSVGLRELLKIPSFGQWLEAHGALFKRGVTLALTALVGTLSGWLGGQSWVEALSIAVSTVTAATWTYEQGKALPRPGKQPAPTPEVTP